MKKISLISLLFLILVCSFPCFSQVGWKWGIGQRVYGPSLGSSVEGEQVTVDNLGNVFSIGFCESDDSIVTGGIIVRNPNRNLQLCIVKSDPNGHVMWVLASPDGFSYENAGRYLVTDSNANIYFYAAYAPGTYTLGGVTLTSSKNQMFLVKISPAGTVLWAKNIGGNGTPGSIGIDGSGQIYLAGSLQGATDTFGSIVLHNTDATGATADLFLAKYDASGNVIWAENYGGADNDLVKQMAVTQSGEIFVEGLYNSASMNLGGITVTHTLGTHNDFFAAFDNSGNPLWAKNVQRHLVINAINTDAAENLYVTGFYDSAILIGSSNLPVPGGLLDVVVAKYNASGSPVWARSAGGTLQDKGLDIVVDACNNVWITIGMGVVSPGAGYTINLSGSSVAIPANSIDPLLIARYDTNGHYYSSVALPSGGDDIACLAVDNKGNLYVSGDYISDSMVIANDTLFYNPAVYDSSTHSSTAVEALFIAKYSYAIGSCNPSAVGDLSFEQSNITIFPNPANQTCMLHSEKEWLPNSSAEMFDVMGKLIYSVNLFNHDTEISVSGIPTGLYYCRIVQPGENTVVKKIEIIH